MNQVIIKGRLVKDPAMNKAQDMAIARFTVAVDRMKKGEADFISCVAFGKTAEFIDKYFKKGKEILLNGRIQTGSYDKDGVKVYTTDVIVNTVEFCGSSTPDATAIDTKQETIPGFEKLNDSDIPF